MRRSVLLFSAMSGIIYLSLTSYQSGPASGGQGNRTTSGSNATCGGGCHGVNNTNTSIAIKLMEGATQVTNGKYKPNTLYTVTLSATNTISLPAKYGFQLTAVKGTGTQAGTLTASGSLHTSTAGTGGLTVVEQSSAISATNGSATTPSFSWLSPATTSGNVTFHVIMNAVNGNNNADASDHASTANFSFAEQSLSVDDISASMIITAYPNPVKDRLNIKLEHGEKGRYTVAIFDLKGTWVNKQVMVADDNSEELLFETGSLSPGLYLVQITKGSGTRMITVRKQ